jgi:hypothetical protein
MKKYKSKIEFVWDRDYLEYAGHKFPTHESFMDFILDNTALLLADAVKDEKIHYITEIEPINP